MKMCGTIVVDWVVS